MNSPTALVSQDPLFAEYQLESLGHLIVPEFSSRFSFQVDIVPSECPDRLVFGLVTRNPANAANAQTTGFVARIDLEQLEVWDHLQGQGVLGALEPEGGLEACSDEEPLLLSWEIELHGQSLLPRLMIGGQQFLYPAIHCPNPTLLEAIVGCAGPWTGDARNLFLHPALWRESIALPAPSIIADANWAGLSSE